MYKVVLARLRNTYFKTSSSLCKFPAYMWTENYTNSSLLFISLYVYSNCNPPGTALALLQREMQTRENIFLVLHDKYRKIDSQVFFHKLNFNHIMRWILNLSTQFPNTKLKILFVCIGHVVQANRIYRSVFYSIQKSSVRLYRENPHVLSPVFFSKIAISRRYGGKK